MIDALDALRGQAGDHVIEIDGRRLALSNIDKPMYGAQGMTKLDVMRYYARVAPVLLPHLRGRAITMKRYPDGAAAEWFFNKRCPEHRPDWVAVSPPLGRSHIHYCMIEDRASIVWAANLAALELHAPLARADRPHNPTSIVFDLDPGPGATFGDSAFVALRIRDLLRELQLESYVKTSGLKGLQLYVPLNHDRMTFELTKRFAHKMAKLLEHQNRELVIADMARHLRPGKIFIDWSQNDDSKTTVNAYSLRGGHRPTVSTPLRWTEVEDVCGSESGERLTFEPGDVIRRIETSGDLFKPVVNSVQDLALPGLRR